MAHSPCGERRALREMDGEQDRKILCPSISVRYAKKEEDIDVQTAASTKSRRAYKERTGEIKERNE